MPAINFVALSPAAPCEAYREPAIAIAAARAGAIGIVDLAFVDDQAGMAAAFAMLVEHGVDRTERLTKLGDKPIAGRIGFRSLVGHLPHFLSQGAPQAVAAYAIIAGDLAPYDATLLAADIQTAKQAGFTVAVEVTSPAEAALAADAGAQILIAKGHEAAGRVGEATTYILLQQLVGTYEIPVWAQGGIGYDTATAAAIIGAAGVVLDSQLFLCRDAGLDQRTIEKLERLDGSETTLVSLESPGLYLRLMGEIARSDAKTLRAAVSAAVNDGQNLDSLLLVGQDACFASRMAQRGGAVSGVIATMAQHVQDQLAVVGKANVLASGSELALAHGTAYPIVQGAMTRVSDNADFALAVAREGGLPFLALSLMRGAEIETLLADTAQKLGDMPWGVGLLGFVPPALRQEQMAVVDKYKPPFALIAGGRPDQAKAMEQAGTKTYLHVPSPLLLSSFIEMGSRRFIFEGKECGGHVGPRSSFILWQSMIDVLLDCFADNTLKAKPSEFCILFAGGIHDAASAAMVAALAAPLTTRGVKVGFLLGTAYLFTREAVDTGAIVDKFQKAALACNETVLLETGPGHSIRCIESPYKKVFDEKRASLEKQARNRDEIREELELMNLGRLRVASKGLGRQQKALPDQEQWETGMYMIGQIAAMRDQVATIKELHMQIADGQAILSNARVNAMLSIEEQNRQQAREQQAEPIAIVGMSCQFPQANDVETFWANILGKVDAIDEIPATHFDWRKLYDKDALARDKMVSKWGGFLPDLVFDPSPYGIPPSSLESIDAMQVLILEAARAALVDAGYKDRKFLREKTSVILANAGHGPITALYSLRSMLDWKLSHLSESAKEEIKQELPEWTEDSFAGYLGNVAAGRVANRLDLKGINFSIDAACASSLAALYVGISDLRSRASDVVLLGATDTHNQPGDYLSFSKTHALSPDGRCKTFDASANGIVISEGIAILVLKRLSDAERDGDRIYALIKGIGGSSDGRDLSLTAPRPAGQMLALERAYRDADISPATIGIVEAHGTGTVAGDKAEVEALSRVFAASGAEIESCAIGSVKTNIGHTKAAAGLASIIKIAKALHHKVLPPTINVTEPSPSCKFGQNPFYVNTESRPWITTDKDHPRRGGVSAFGFGGTNFHTVLEEYEPPCQKAADQAPGLEAWPAELFVWKAANTKDLLKAVAQTQAAARKLEQDFSIETTATSQSRRRLFDLAYALYSRQKGKGQSTDTDINNDVALSIVANSLSDLIAKIEGAIAQITAQGKAFTMPGGISFADELIAKRKDKIALLFPGQGSQKINMLKELSLYFPEISRTFSRLDRKIANGQSEGQKQGQRDLTLSHYIYPPATLSADIKERQQQALTSTDIAQPALGMADLAMHALLAKANIKADMAAGHSFGELVALSAAGAYDAETLMDLAVARGSILRSCADRNPGAMAAVSASREQVQAFIDKASQVDRVYLANVNAPNQIIIAGSIEAIDKAIIALKELKIGAKRIPVSAAFHSPLMQGADQQIASAVQDAAIVSPTIPVYGNTTATVYDDKPEAIKNQLARHALAPVLFAESLQAMYADGARVFVEVGPGAVLTGLVESTLGDRGDVIALSCERTGAKSAIALEHFLTTMGRLAALSSTCDLGLLFYGRLANHKLRINRKINSLDKQLLYRVNSAFIEKIGAPKTKARPAIPSTPSALKAAPLSQTAPQAMPKALPPAPPTRPQHNGQHPMDPNKQRSPLPTPQLRQGQSQGSNVDRVMLEFQQSMLEMTNRFLETQQNVMLAYLQANGRMPGQAQMPMLMQMPEPMQMPVSAYSNGNGNGNSNGNGNHAYSNNIPLQTAPASDHDSALDAVPDKQELVAEALSAPAPAGVIDTEALVDNLYEIVSERTGYPRSMLDPTLDLEADLGIDSIKRVEILNNFRKLLPESTQAKLESGIEKLAGTKTLQGIIDWIGTLNDLDEAVAVQSVADNAVQAKSTTNYERVARGRVVQQDLPAPQPTVKQAPDLTLVVASEGKSAAVKQVISMLTASGYKNVVLERASLADQTSISANLDALREMHGSIQAVINICDGENADVLLPTFALAKAVESELKLAAEAGKNASWINVTYLGGDFTGQSNKNGAGLEALAQQGGVVGLTKTIAKEWPEVHVKVVDVSTIITAKDLASCIHSELTAADSIVEIGYRGKQRTGLDVVDAPFRDLPILHDAANPVLDEKSVVLVTGGARGITARITLDLARKYRPTFVIVGRMAKPDEVESKVTYGLRTAKEIKAALIEDRRSAGEQINVREIEKTYQQLLREREIRTSLDALKAAGATVKYASVDISDQEAFGELIDNIYETGNLDGVIHGAGIIEDALIKDKTVESFARVFDTKIKGAITLARHVRLETLRFMYFFSSVVGRTGNSGQADYVSANEALNKIARDLKAKAPATTRIASLMWGPWQAGMAPPELEAVFASHGWSMIQPQDGSLCFMETLDRDCDQVEVMLVGKLAGNGDRPMQSSRKTYVAPQAMIQPQGVLINGSAAAKAGTGAIGVTVDTSKHLYLNDHKFDGIPVMPMAGALEIMLEAARSVYPDKEIVEVAELDIPAGIVFQTAKKDFVVEIGVDTQDSDLLSVQLHSKDPRKAHFRCKVKFAAKRASLPKDGVITTDLSSMVRTRYSADQLSKGSVKLPPPGQLYGSWLFHGPTFQGISEVLTINESEISGEVKGSAPAEVVTTAGDSKWIVDPIRFDSAMQLAGIWARHHQDVTVLPTGFRKMHVYQPIKGETATARVFLGPASASDLLCDLAIYNADGSLALIVEGLGGIASKTFNRFAAQPVQELAK